MNRSHDPTDVDWALMGRYFAGELTAVERRELEAWIVAEPGRRDEVTLLRRLWNDAGAIPTAERVEELWRSVAQRRISGSPPAHSSPAGPHRHTPRRIALVRNAGNRSRWTLPVGIGAAAALIVSMVVADRQYQRESGPVENPPPREFRTASGQRATIQLADGSRVELAASSVMRVETFTPTSRTVSLEGEAVFDVVHDARRPFEVRTAGSITRDLGTKFGIRAYPEDPGARVFVVEGLVAVAGVADSAASHVLRPGDLARLDDGGVISVETGVDTAQYLAWTIGRIILRDEPLSSAAMEIARRHGVSVRIPDERVARLRITVDMRLGSVEETLDAVTIPLGLRYESSSDGVVIVR